MTLEYFRKAIEAILEDTRRGSVRAEIAGNLGWRKPPQIDKRLVGATLTQAINSNAIKEKREKKSKVTTKKT